MRGLHGAPKRRPEPPATFKDIVKALIALLALSLGGCGSIFGRDPAKDTHAILDKRIVGMSVGDFFERYGAPLSRDEGRDGSLGFVWEGGLTKISAGPTGPEALICRLRLGTGKDGRISAVVVLRDGEGLRRLSRCVELIDRP
jgi:hypothetical protein